MTESKTDQTVFDEWFISYDATANTTEEKEQLLAAFSAGRLAGINEAITEAQRVGIQTPLSLVGDPYVRGSIDSRNIIVNALRLLNEPLPEKPTEEL
jgi:hypothetical protein